MVRVAWCSFSLILTQGCLLPGCTRRRTGGCVPPYVTLKLISSYATPCANGDPLLEFELVGSGDGRAQMTATALEQGVSCVILQCDKQGECMPAGPLRNPPAVDERRAC